MKDTSGKGLEDLVRSIEKFLLPEGFTVEVRERVFAEDGQQLAEFDVVIKGNLGASSVSWLIQCRDRPSSGPAPGEWIEQLVTRRQRFNFDKVFAVSTTGFSRSAKDCAQQFGVTLRTVENVAEIRTDFQVHGFYYQFSGFEFLGPIRGELEDTKRQINVDLQRPLLKRVGEMHFEPLPIFVTRNRTSKPLPDRGIEFLCFAYPGWVQLLLGTEVVRVKNIHIPLQIKYSTVYSKALFARVYSEGDRAIWAEASFEADSPKGKFITRMQVFKQYDKMSAKIFNDSTPDGYYVDRIAIYGWNNQKK